MAWPSQDWVRGRITDAFAKREIDNPWLDCLRTLAIALVLLRHGQRVLDEGTDLNFLQILSLNGWVGVDLFFVLSGYLVTSGFLSKHNSFGRAELVGYAKRRVFRIVPAYVLVLLLVLVGYFPGFVFSDEYLLFRTLYHLAFLQDVLPSDINVVFWSLGVEIKFYVLIPFIAALIYKSHSVKHAVFIILSIAALSIVIRSVVYLSLVDTSYYTFWSTLRSPFYACLEPLMLGFLIAFLETHGLLRQGKKTALTLFVVAWVTLLLWLAQDHFMYDISWWDASVQPVLIAAIFAVMVTAAVQLKKMRLPLEIFFRFTSRLSYSLYLVHFPLIPLCLGTSLAFEAGPIGFWLTFLTLSTAHALVIYVFVEYPLMQRKAQNLAKTAKV